MFQPFVQGLFISRRLLDSKQVVICSEQNLGQGSYTFLFIKPHLSKKESIGFITYVLVAAIWELIFVCTFQLVGI